ncbi:Na+/H+ antiporter NhaC family protein [Anaerococcus sp. AGMB00486]|uniref:Na+/H+ antiporter NhaC family protein n=1 Tax=Anaerococcus faecalis TaxID=2742993 RepID=A0ABX2N9G7_9FIRM|nr:MULTISPECIES: Na+/H+ antiporter NhaC family protein [Anaerococcus]MDY3006545.1 Na+/H+ antiporter NhaC family protein [Anaerococcus porci]NVF11204.1 Na+/H+ antiporter NhaC family protein [Anaerococcus faecalis]
MKNNDKISGKALIPFLVFVLIYLSTGIILHLNNVEMAFYQLPAPIAAFVGIISAFLLFKGSIDEKFDNLIEGCGDSNIIIMCLIYLLAGAFSTVANASGGVDSVVGLGLSFIPARFLTAGVFLIACFISIATGSSVGTITALGPIAVGLATSGGINLALMLGSLVGGSMFGDNLSVISDTTIAATRTQNCDMKDKFRMNMKMALPSGIITFILLLIFGKPETQAQASDLTYNIIEIIPYIFVLVVALMGVNVFLVLTGGIVLSGIVLLINNGFNLLALSQTMWEGFTGMFEIFLLSMLIGGLSNMVSKEGGINWIIAKIRKFAKDEKSGELGIASLVSLADIAVANNTVAIIISGPIAKKMCNEYKIDPRRSASLLDTFSCVLQGFVPYGAQVLIAAGFTKGLVAPFELIPFFWYQFILAIISIISIYIPFTKAKDKWNFEYDMPESKIANHLKNLEDTEQALS